MFLACKLHNSHVSKTRDDIKFFLLLKSKTGLSFTFISGMEFKLSGEVGEREGDCAYHPFLTDTHLKRVPPKQISDKFIFDNH